MGTSDTKIRVTCAENPELLNVLTLEPGTSKNIVFQTSPTAANSVYISAVSFHSAYPPPPPPPPPLSLSVKSTTTDTFCQLSVRLCLKRISALVTLPPTCRISLSLSHTHTHTHTSFKQSEANVFSRFDDLCMDRSVLKCFVVIRSKQKSESEYKKMNSFALI